MKTNTLICGCMVLALTSYSGFASQLYEEKDGSFHCESDGLKGVKVSGMTVKVFDLPEQAEDQYSPGTSQIHDIYWQQFLDTTSQEDIKIVGVFTEIPESSALIDHLANLAFREKIIILAAGDDGKKLGFNDFKKHLVDLAEREAVQGRIVFVGATEEKETYQRIAKKSNRAGDAQKHFITMQADSSHSEEDLGARQEENLTLHAAYGVVKGFEELLTAYPQAPIDEVIKIIYETALKQVAEGNLNKNFYGQGQVNFKEAMECLSELFDQEEVNEEAGPDLSTSMNDNSKILGNSSDSVDEVDEQVEGEDKDGLTHRRKDYTQENNVYEEDGDSHVSQQNPLKLGDHGQYSNASVYFFTSGQLLVMALCEAARGGIEFGKAAAPSVRPFLIKSFKVTFNVGRRLLPVIADGLWSGIKILAKGAWQIGKAVYHDFTRA